MVKLIKKYLRKRHWINRVKRGYPVLGFGVFYVKDDMCQRVTLSGHLENHVVTITNYGSGYDKSAHKAGGSGYLHQPTLSYKEINESLQTLSPFPHDK